MLFGIIIIIIILSFPRFLHLKLEGHLALPIRTICSAFLTILLNLPTLMLIWIPG